jgi:hypothetical protein
MLFPFVFHVLALLAFGLFVLAVTSNIPAVLGLVPAAKARPLTKAEKAKLRSHARATAKALKFAAIVVTDMVKITILVILALLLLALDVLRILYSHQKALVLDMRHKCGCSRLYTALDAQYARYRRECFPQASLRAQPSPTGHSSAYDNSASQYVS